MGAVQTIGSPPGADPWGHDEPSAVDPATVPPLPPRLAALAALAGPRPRRADDRWPEAHELPEVQRLEADGWRVLEPAPQLACLPALWPRASRCWVPDRLPRVVLEQRTSERAGGPVTVRPPTDAEIAVDDEHADHCARNAGLPAPPRRRIWLLRSPWPEILPLPWLVRALQDIGWAAAGPTPTADPLAPVAARLLADTSPAAADRILAEWQGPAAAAATAWRAVADRPDEHVELALVGAGPDLLAAIRAALGRADLPEADAARLLLATDPASRARAWVPLLHEGLTTVDELTADATWWDPSDAAPVLRAGWAVRDLADLPEAGFEWDAIGWRAAGVTARTLRRLIRCRPTMRPQDLLPWTAADLQPDLVADVLDADPITQPHEWIAYGAGGLGSEVALDWLAHGFDAAQAIAWQARGVVPAEARVWRSKGLGPSDVPSATGEDDVVLPEGSWASMGGRDRRSRTWSVTDPPGTRGRVADGHGRRDR